MENGRKILLEAISEKNLQHIQSLLKNGVDINSQDEYGETVLSKAIFILQSEPEKYSIIKYLLDQGANPKILDQEHGGPLQNAMLNMDTKMLKLLLDYGADPNSEAGFVDSETLYDWAEFDYRFQIYDLRLPEEPTAEDRRNEESWLIFLERLAEKYGEQPPDHLCLLRSRGAKTATEL